MKQAPSYEEQIAIMWAELRQLREAAGKAAAFLADLEYQREVDHAWRTDALNDLRAALAFESKRDAR